MSAILQEVRELNLIDFQSKPKGLSMRPYFVKIQNKVKIPEDYISL